MAIPAGSRVLVTGGAGAIGSNVVRTLTAARCNVAVLDDLSSGHTHLLPDGVTFILGSVADDVSLEKAFGFRPDFVIHMAALFANQNSVEHPALDLTVNGMGTLKVLARAQQARATKMLNVSSSCVYGAKPIMDERETDLLPETPYAITKLLGEKYCDFWARFHGLDVVTVRPFNSYGPGELPGRYRNVIPNFFKTAMEGRPLTITGTGDETRDFTFVGDIVAGILGALFGRTHPGDVFNLASGTETRIVDLARMINEVSGNAAGIQFAPRRDWDHVSTRRGVIAKAMRVFDYEPETALQEGLQQTHAWLRSHVPA